MNITEDQLEQLCLELIQSISYSSVERSRKRFVVEHPAKEITTLQIVGCLHRQLGVFDGSANTVSQIITSTTEQSLIKNALNAADSRRCIPAGA
ncbi:hypothetical protein [Marinagarivorans cellulosilyticus]|uniref:hypothetical protein n=1 Tax=Marinagarivorans cellulosilyticus TaxID=2721545 RepID=UPI001F264D62|nr:hypothetical protein [Marinagarivorans cellulosilyticus]